MNQSTSAFGFRELDALLEQAFALDEPERSRFVDGLEDDKRQQLRQLLELSNAMTLKSVAADARVAFERLDRIERATSAAPLDTPAAGRWRLHRELGSGGMGQVFYATREAPEDAEASSHDYVQEAAIKVLWSLRADDEVRARFLRERRLLASLHHPGLARFVDGGFLADGRPWFAMEYVAGQAIDAHARDLPLVDRLRLFREVCATVAYAHQRLIVHRDIKPLNILVDASGRARLLDFGIAGVLEDIDDGVHTRTAGGPLTLQYASPEQLTGAMVTGASDIYQLGLLLYEMLTGAPPYNLKDAPLSEALDVVCHRTPSKPSAHRRSVARDLDAIVMTALAKNPDERYRSATDMAEDVERYLQGRPVRAVSPTLWYVTRRFLRRNLAIVSIVSVAAFALTVATIVSVRMAREATAQASRSQAVQQILSDVFRKADPFENKGATVTLADALVRAKPDIAARVGNDPLLAWEVNLTLAQIYENLGLADEEGAAYRAMLEAAQRLGGAGHDYRVLTAVAGIGNVLARTNPSEAVRYFDANMPARPASVRAVEVWLDGQYYYVGALTRVGEFGRADAGVHAMAEVVQTYGVKSPRRLGRLSQLLAGVAKRSGDIPAETQHWKDAVHHMRVRQDPIALAITLNNFAIHLGRHGQYAASEDAFREAMAIFDEADFEGGTFASILRAYAGLLFRTGRAKEAVTTLQRALSVATASRQPYARFIAELKLASYTFATGDVQTTLKVMASALPAAREAFPNQPATPKRMLRLFAKALVFARAFSLARTALGYSDDGCRSEEQLLSALERLEHAADKQRRTLIWSALRDLETKAQSHGLRQDDMDAFVVLYHREKPIFFDALDEWRVLHRLTSSAGATPLPKGLADRYATLNDARRTARALVEGAYQQGFWTSANALGASMNAPTVCPQ